MKTRGYKVDSSCLIPWYRGKRCGPFKSFNLDKVYYLEHDDVYLKECLENLK